MTFVPGGSSTSGTLIFALLSAPDFGESILSSLPVENRDICASSAAISFKNLLCRFFLRVFDGSRVFLFNRSSRQFRWFLFLFYYFLLFFSFVLHRWHLHFPHSQSWAPRGRLHFRDIRLSFIRNIRSLTHISFRNSRAARLADFERTGESF